MKVDQVKRILFIVFLGAIGSGLWSIAGDPLLTWFINVFITIAKTINEGYYDLLHANIGKGLHERSSLFLKFIFTTFTVLIIIIIPVISQKLYYILYSPEKNKEKRKSGLTKKFRLKILIIFSTLYVIIGVPFLMSTLIIDLYNNRAIVYIERSIDILSSKLERKEILQLKASYRSVEDANSFYKIYDNMQSTAKKKNIVLPEFNIAR